MNNGEKGKKGETEVSVKLVVQIIISFFLLGFGCYVLITVDWKDNPEFAAAAMGWVGLVTGYWLR